MNEADRLVKRFAIRDFSGPNDDDGWSDEQLELIKEYRRLFAVADGVVAHGEAGNGQQGRCNSDKVVSE